MTSSKPILNILIFLLLLLSSSLHAKSFYISTTGSDQDKNCEDTGPEIEWGSFITVANHCAQPGDKIYFKSGTYYSNSPVFNSGRLNANLRGDASNSVKIAPAPSATGEWPVRFEGASFSITAGGGVVVEGIEFYRPKDSQLNNIYPILAIGIPNVDIRNNYIHGALEEFDQMFDLPNSADCIQVPAAAGPEPTNNILIKKNEISYCSQDAIDITGSEDVDVIDNYIHHARQIQVKGGAQNIAIRRNRIENMVYGIVGGGMACTFGYCGNPELENIAVENRFSVKDMVIKYNTISTLSKNWAFNFSGWVDTKIKRNTISGTNPNFNQEIFSSKNWGTQYFDDLARQYCDENPYSCSACTHFNSENESLCRRIDMKAKNVSFAKNTISAANTKIWMTEEDSIDLGDEQSICFNAKNNVLDAPDNVYWLWNGVSFTFSKELPIKHSRCGQLYY